MIPVFNYDVRELVQEIHKQAVSAQVDFEILVIDDASDEEFRKINRSLKKLEFVSYSEETINLGRSKIRNKLACTSRYNNLLFMDCDSGIIKQDYIRSYIDVIAMHPVVYGGRLYKEDVQVASNYKLHWLYGIKREQSTADHRNIEPNRSFQTNNFLIKKDLILNIGFNEKITGYGHEDTLFGYELKKRNISIKHIDNPVVHLGLEPSEEFLRKTREGIKNLRRIMRINGNEKKLVRDITILAYYKRIEKLGLQHAVEFFYNKYEHILRRNLLGRNPNLLVFDLYKLGYLCSIKRDNF
ncbi:MAG: glycosyltransferase [Bacteroidales bacterium]|nr:glycosyltransferase [Bacteroidales bacterium]MBN2820135.1 glycosyltransferase [Bacteroidales bacterium]